MIRTQYRQGDVVLEQETPGWATIPDNATRRTWPVIGRRSVVLAHGEKSGHSHVLESTQDIDLYERDGTLYCRVAGESTLIQKVQEGEKGHDPIVIPAGDYKVVQQQEYDPALGYREVLD